MKEALMTHTLTYLLAAFLSSLTSIKYLKTDWSNANVIIGSNKELYVRTKSTVPYSLVDNIDVYKGSKKKLISCVHILPKAIIAVFFTNSDCLVISIKPSLILQMHS